MSLFAKVKCFLTCLIVYYITYLYNYKCPTLSTPLQEGIEHIIHPLSNQHSVLCEYLHSGVEFVEPYHAKVHAFLDDNVHNTQFFIDNKIEDKISDAKDKFTTYVYPYVHELYKLTDVVEVHVYDHLSGVYDQVQKTLKKD
ncbi:hypothetical protein Cantr_09269 [Candida viswanathii]|uniref:Uncharacterized protein n=1 Tax=Candida viswanathii TaxID=5486 RepID=A0A367Y9F1_9ASCO|nr:hypothetical protein Cantr_09269 [Candida viswanathii]